MNVGSSAPSYFSTAFKKVPYRKMVLLVKSSLFFLSVFRGKSRNYTGNIKIGIMTELFVVLRCRARAPPFLRFGQPQISETEDTVMAKRDKYHPDYKKLYPGEDITPTVLSVLKQSDRKMKYMEVELKQGTFHQDPATQTAVFVPSREDSLERLQEEDKAEFPSTTLSPEDEAVHNDELDRLRKARTMLLPDEQALVKALFDDGMSEREYAKMLGISQKAVNKRWHKVRAKLKKFMKN